MNFKEIPKQQLQEMGRQGGIMHRSKDLQWAWDNADKLKEEVKTLSKPAIAKKYNISIRAVYRIVTGK